MECYWMDVILRSAWFHSCFQDYSVDVGGKHGVISVLLSQSLVIRTNPIEFYLIRPLRIQVKEMVEIHFSQSRNAFKMSANCHFESLAQNFSNSIANALFCTYPSIWNSINMSIVCIGSSHISHLRWICHVPSMGRTCWCPIFRWNLYWSIIFIWRSSTRRFHLSGAWSSDKSDLIANSQKNNTESDPMSFYHHEPATLSHCLWH